MVSVWNYGKVEVFRKLDIYYIWLFIFFAIQRKGNRVERLEKQLKRKRRTTLINDFE